MSDARRARFPKGEATARRLAVDARGELRQIAARMLKVGERAPEIKARTSDGTEFVLSAQGGLCTVIYFFPKAFTPGCTVETKHFRENHVEIALAGASIVGISTDSYATQCHFADVMKLPFPMIADEDQTIARTYGVLWPVVGIARRVTFVVEPNLRVAAVFEHELRVKQHRDKVLAFINERLQVTRPRAVRSGARVALRPAPPSPEAHASPSPGALGAALRPSGSMAVQRPSIGGRFTQDRHSAGGASGDIYQGTDTRTGRTVAVKILRGGPARDDARFAREATILAELRDPGIVEYVAHGIDPDGKAFLVTEWLEGEPLGERLTRGHLTVDETIALGIQVGAALGAAHARGVVHRDLKPSNLFLVGGAADRVKIIDFGVSRSTAAGGQITAPGDVIGTPGYMAPEQANAQTRPDARSDVFSLGCVLFKCLTGEEAFGGKDIVSRLMAVLNNDAPLASERNPAVPPALSAVISRMLTKAPDARPSDGRAVAAELAALGRPYAPAGQQPAWPSPSRGA